MEGLIISLLPALTSTSFVVVIAKIALSLLRRIAKKNDDKVEALQKTNAALIEQNKILEGKLNVMIESIEGEISKTNEAIVKVSEDVAVNKNSELELRKLVDEGTTIRNELRCLIEAKKE